MKNMCCLMYVQLGDGTTNRRPAPLQHVSGTCLIRDTVARVTLVQTFLNPLANAAIEATYKFPLYEGAAVCGFEAEVDGRKIVGRVQEKVAAKKEYEEAVKEGKVASLLEQEKPDVFQASVGNIPPGKAVLIRITLISELKNDADADQIRFVLPTVVAPRYGAYDSYSSQPAAIVDPSTSKLTIDLSCAMSKPITSIQSPSHTIEVHLGTNETKTESSSNASFDPNRAGMTLASDSFLDRDLVVIIKSSGLDEPRALIERHPADGTHAVALTFSPRFALNPIRSSELIFLVDRSGSMQGKKIEQAGHAMQLFLKSIPSEHHYINIVGFGSTHKALFSQSVEYDAKSLKAATSYAEMLQADMGGTEIASAFREVFQRRRRDVPTQVFLLTDGQVWNVDAIVQSIGEAVKEGEKSDAFVRVFTLGVGASVSHYLIEAVARAGDGYAQLVVEGERAEKKVVKMLKSALTPPVRDMCVQWLGHDSMDEEDFEMVEVDRTAHNVNSSLSTTAAKAPISLFSTSLEEPSPPSPSPLPDILSQIQQAPFQIPPLYRGARFTTYAILSPSIPIPKHISLRGTTPDGPVELAIDVGSVQEGETMLHTLTARKLLQDMEEGASYINALGKSAVGKNQQLLKRLGIRLVKAGTKDDACTAEPIPVPELTKREMINIGLKYGLSSKHTSWVAIDEHKQKTIIQAEQSFDNFFGQRNGGHISPESAMRPLRTVAARGLTPIENYNPPPGSRGVSSFGSSRRSRVPSSCPSTLTDTPIQQQHQYMRQPRQLDSPGLRSNATLRSECAQVQRIEDATQTGQPPEHAAQAASLDPLARLHAIVQHQSFDGSFPLVPHLAALLLSASVEELQRRLDELRGQHVVDQLSDEEWRSVWATCLAVAFLRERLSELQEEWELVVEKAESRVDALVKSGEVAAKVREAAAATVAKQE